MEIRFYLKTIRRLSHKYQKSKHIFYFFQTSMRELSLQKELNLDLGVLHVRIEIYVEEGVLTVHTLVVTPLHYLQLRLQVI